MQFLIGYGLHTRFIGNIEPFNVDAFTKTEHFVNIIAELNWSVALPVNNRITRRWHNNNGVRCTATATTFTI